MSNTDLHQAGHRAFNTEGAVAAAEAFADDITFLDAARGLSLKGKAEAIAWLSEWKAGFSNAMVAEPQYIDGGDWTVCRFQARGTNDGSVAGMPATGRRLDVPFCEVMRWQDGMAVDGALYYDAMTMMIQLGHMEPPPA